MLELNPSKTRPGALQHGAWAQTAAHGAATVQGAGLVNNGQLTLTNVDVERNRGVATGLSGFACGASTASETWERPRCPRGFG